VDRRRDEDQVDPNVLQQEGCWRVLLTFCVASGTLGTASYACPQLFESQKRLEQNFHKFPERFRKIYVESEKRISFRK